MSVYPSASSLQGCDGRKLEGCLTRGCVQRIKQLPHTHLGIVVAQIDKETYNRKVIHGLLEPHPSR
jgi:hypothetical protein